MGELIKARIKGYRLQIARLDEKFKGTDWRMEHAMLLARIEELNWVLKVERWGDE